MMRRGTELLEERKSPQRNALCNVYSCQKYSLVQVFKQQKKDFKLANT